LHAEIIQIPPENNVGFSLIDVPNPKAGEDISTHFDPRHHALMINGGYFNPDFSPTGHCKIDNRVIRPGVSPSLSGFVAIDGDGRLSLLAATDDPAPFPTVLQNGPYLIDPGGGIGIHSRTGKRAARTAIGRLTDDTLVILVTEPIELYDLAREAKRDFPTMERLLNLDGGPSTALKTPEREIRNTAPVRNYLAKAMPPGAD